MKKFIFVAILVCSCFVFSCKTKSKLGGNNIGNTVQEHDQLKDIQEQLPDADIQETSSGIMVRFDSAILFNFNSSVLTPAAEDKARRLSVALTKYKNPHLQIDGHTDNVGDGAHNQWLSERRAMAVQKYLASLGTISSEAISTRGFGAGKPIKSNDTASGRAKNRRVEITILR